MVNGIVFVTIQVALVATIPPRSARGFAVVGRNHNLIGGSSRQQRQQQNHMTTRFFSSSLTDKVGSRGGKSENNNNRLFEEEVNIIYDSKCNVCKLEIDFLRRRDERLALKRAEVAEATTSSPPNPQPRLRFTDLESGDYNPDDPANGGITYEVGMASMHAITSDGKVINGVPVFRLAYEQVNLGWLFAITKIPWIKRIADKGYDIFAKYRTRITRGQSVETLVEAYREKMALEQQQQQEAENCEVCQVKESIK